MRKISILLSLVALGTSAQLSAQEEAQGQQKLAYATTPEGKTLPAGVARIRLPYQMATGTSGYDKDGKKSDNSFKYSASGAAFIFEYGLSDKMSLQLKTDFILDQKTTADTSLTGYKTLKSSTYSSTFSSLSAATGVAITDQTSLEAGLKAAVIGGCVAGGTAQATCVAAYEAGSIKSDSLPSTITAVFGSGSAAVTAKQYAAGAAATIESTITSGIKSATDNTGGKGLGDTIVGVLYEAYHANPLFISVAGGLRLPTGNRDAAAGELDGTRGAYEVGARFNLDYLPIDWFMASWENQSEVALAGTTRKVAGVTEKRTRVGVRNVGFLYLKPSWTMVSPSLDGFKTNLGVTYDYDSAEQSEQNGIKTTAAHSHMMWMTANVGYSLLGMGIPLQFDLEYSKPYSGKNALVAVTKTTATLKAFAKF